MQRPPLRSLVVATLAAAAIAGCGTEDDRAQARSTVERFYGAIRQHRPEVACRQLSAATVKQLENQTSQSCPGVIDRLQDAGGAVVTTKIYVTNARVDVRGGGSVFLGREPTGWKIDAFGCKATEGKVRSRPMDCEVAA